MRAPSVRSFACVRLFLHSPPLVYLALPLFPNPPYPPPPPPPRHHRPRPNSPPNVPLFLYRAFTCLVTLIIPEKSILQQAYCSSLSPPSAPFPPLVLLFRPLCDYARGGSLSCEELGLQVSSRRAWMEIDVNVPRKQPPPILLSRPPPSPRHALLHAPRPLPLDGASHG